MQGECAGATVKLHQLTARQLTLNNCSFVSYYKFRSEKLQCWDILILKEVSVVTSLCYFMVLRQNF